MFDAFNDAALVTLIGLFGGCLLGLAARLGRFCTLGAIEDWRYGGQQQRMRMWLLAIGVSMAGVGLLTLSGLFDPRLSIYLSEPFSPVASVAGGLLFGYGMALAGTCGFGALARAGGGDLRGMVIALVMAVSAYVMLSGPLAALRVRLIDATALEFRHDGFEQALSAATGVPTGGIGLAIGIAVVGLALRSAADWLTRERIFWGATVGVAILSAWAGTHHVAVTGFDAIQVSSHSYTAPLGNSLLFLMTSSGGGYGFAVGSVAGVLVGATAGSLIRGHFRWEACEDPRELRRQLLGAMLMGFGGVLALGCTIGQGISAMSVLSYSAPLVFVSILVGASLGLRQLVVGWGGA